MSWKMKSEKLNELIREALFEEPYLDLPVIETEISVDQQYDILDDLIYDALLEEDYSPLPIIDRKIVQWIDWLEEIEEKQLKSIANAHVQQEPDREEEKIVQTNRVNKGQQSPLEPKKCDICDKSFLFPVNDRRHRWKHRDKNLEKNMKAERDQLRRYWEKLDHEKARKIMSIKDAVLPVDLKEVQVNDIIKAVSRHIENLDNKNQGLRHIFLAKHLLRPMEGGDCPPLRLLFQALCSLSDDNFLRGTLDPEMQRTVFPSAITMAKIEEQGLLASFEYLVEYCMMKAWTDDRNHNFAELLQEEEEKAKNQMQSTASTSKATKPSASQRKKAKARRLNQYKPSEEYTVDNPPKDINEHYNLDADTQQSQMESNEKEVASEENASEYKKEQGSPYVASTSSAVAPTSSTIDANVDSFTVDATHFVVGATSSTFVATSSIVVATQSDPVTQIGDFMQVQDNTFLPQNQVKAIGTLETRDRAAITLEKNRCTCWGDYEMDDDFSAFRPEPTFHDRGSSSMQPGTHLQDEETWKDVKMRHPSKHQQSNHTDIRSRRLFIVPSPYADQRPNTRDLGSYTDQETITQGGFRGPYNRSGTSDKGYGKSSASTPQIVGERKLPAAQREPISRKNKAVVEWAKNPTVKVLPKPPEKCKSMPLEVQRPLPPTSVWAENFNKNKAPSGVKKQISEASNPAGESVQAENALAKSVPVAESRNSKQPSFVLLTRANKDIGPKGAGKAAMISGPSDEKTKISDNSRQTLNIHHLDGHGSPVQSKDSKPPQGRVVPTIPNKNKKVTWAKEVAKNKETAETSGWTDEWANVPDHATGCQNACPVVASNIKSETAANFTIDFDRAFSDYMQYLHQNWDAALTSPDSIGLEESWMPYNHNYKVALLLLAEAGCLTITITKWH